MSVNATQTDLLQLIYRHLKENGYHTAASELQKHAPQTGTKKPTQLIDVYNSWLNDSKKKRRTSKHSKDGRATPKASAGLASLDDEGDEMSQSLLPQTPPASTRKSAASTPVKAAPVVSPCKQLLLDPATPAAAGDSSDTTDISGDEAKNPAPVKTPLKDANPQLNSPAAVTASPVAKSTTTKKKRSPSKKAESTKKKAAPVKRKRNNSKSTEKGAKAKKAKSQKVFADGGDSDSDSSLDEEKWKNMFLKMTDSDMARMDLIDAMDLTPKRPAVKRVRKPRAKPAPKTILQDETTDESVIKNEHQEAKTKEKIKKAKKLSSPPPQIQNNTEMTSNNLTPEEQVSELKTKDQSSCNEPSDELTSPKKKKKKKEKAASKSETKDVETTNDEAADHSVTTEKTNSLTQEQLNGNDNEVLEAAVSKKKSKKQKKEKIKMETLAEPVVEQKADEVNDGLPEVLPEVIVKKKKKKKKEDCVENSQTLPEENQVVANNGEDEKVKKKKMSLFSSHSEPILEAIEDETSVEMSEQTPGKKKKKKKSSKEEVETDARPLCETPGPPTEKKKKKSKVKAAEEPQ